MFENVINSVGALHKFSSEIISKTRIAAGDSKEVKINKGEVVRIFTGAKMPLNSNTVVMQENTKLENNSKYSI